MDRLLSLSQAARMAGVPRKVLQQHIQVGDLSTFEGALRLSELRKVFPEVQADKSGMIEKTRRIRDAAAAKNLASTKEDPERMAADLHRLRINYAQLQDELADYKNLATETQDRLLELQERCDRNQAMMLGTLIGWYMNQLKLREKH